jgi:hypothetical protein
MNNLKKILTNKRGATLLMITLLIMTSILTVGLSLGSVVINGLKVSKTQANATQAYFAAEAGAEKFLWEVRKGVFDPPTGKPTCEDGEYINTGFDGCVGTEQRSTLFDGAEYYILYNYDTVDATTTLTNFGEYRGTRRAVRLVY